MQIRLSSTIARAGRLFLIASTFAVVFSWTAAPAAAQQRGQGQGQRPARSVRGVLGGVEMTAADSAVKMIVDRLDFDS